MIPVRRDVRFSLPSERIADWHQAGVTANLYMNALSLLFPAGERYFMDAVRHYRDQIHDPVLREQVAGFIGQEAMHTREHVEYNDLIEAAGLPAHQLDQWLKVFLARLRKFTGAKFALAVTIALEHYTALFSQVILQNPDVVVGGEAGYKQVWMWHAYEETEHKAVAFDVWNAVMKPNLFNYLIRTGSMVVISVVFWSVVTYFNIKLDRAYRRHIGSISLLDRLALANRLFGLRHGLFPKIWRGFLDYFKPGFHPWDHDNRAALISLESLLNGITEANQQYLPDAQPRRVPLHPQAQAIA